MGQLSQTMKVGAVEWSLEGRHAFDAQTMRRTRRSRMSQGEASASPQPSQMKCAEESRHGTD